jgi:DNA recombination protein RmuC
MDATALLAGLVLGLVLGGALGYLLARGRLAADTASLTGQARAAQERERAAQERLALVDGQLTERFRQLSADALDQSTRRFLEIAEGRLAATSVTAAGELDKRKTEVAHLVELREPWQVQDQRARTGPVTVARRAGRAGQDRSPDAAQLQLDPPWSPPCGARGPRPVGGCSCAGGRAGRDERPVRLRGAGAFTTRTAASYGPSRPPGKGKNIVVDSKVTLAAYLEAAESSDEDLREQRLLAHARHLREHVDRLAAKSYWALLSPAPEFVVLFIPGEAFLAPALERDPGLLEHAMTRRVHIATPTTLVTMLRTAQYAWQQAALSDNARAVFDLGRELYERLGSLGRHVDGLGKALNGAVSAYNQTVGSLESRVLVSARRLNQLGVTGAALDQPR